MADVTISQLSNSVPAGNNLLPFSTGTSTLGSPVSALFQNNKTNIFKKTGSYVELNMVNDEVGNGPGNNLNILQGFNSYVTSSHSLFLSSGNSRGIGIYADNNLDIGLKSKKKISFLPTGETISYGPARINAVKTNKINTYLQENSPVTYTVLRHFNDHINWGESGIVLNLMANYYGGSVYGYGVYFAVYNGYSGTASVITKISDSNLDGRLYWGAPVFIGDAPNRKMYYRDLFFNAFNYVGYTLEITHPLIPISDPTPSISRYSGEVYIYNGNWK